MAGHLSDNTSGKTDNSFCQQTLNISTGVLDFIENTFDSFTNSIEPTIKLDWILIFLIGSLSSKNAVASMSKDFVLPIFSNEALVRINIAASQGIQNTCNQP